MPSLHAMIRRTRSTMPLSPPPHATASPTRTSTSPDILVTHDSINSGRGQQTRAQPAPKPVLNQLLDQTQTDAPQANSARAHATQCKTQTHTMNSAMAGLFLTFSPKLDMAHFTAAQTPRRLPSSSPSLHAPSRTWRCGHVCCSCSSDLSGGLLHLCCHLSMC
jgi:hypothetical protein